MTWKPLILMTIVAMFGIKTFAQMGCTDPNASNFNSSAAINDGSCAYAYTHRTPILKGAFSSPIPESSGLVWTDGKLWTHNDSGNPAKIFQVDTSDGHTLQTVVIDNYPNNDWEDMTADSSFIYIGDFGNNDGTRTNLKILKIAKSSIGSASVVHVNAQAISFSFDDQSNFSPDNATNFDCESVISIGDSLYIFTKDRGDAKTRVYTMPKVPGNYTLLPYTEYAINGLVTGADYNASTKEIVLIGYVTNINDSFLMFLYDYNDTHFFSGNKRRIDISNGMQWQTEGIAYITDQRLAISCESAGSIHSSLYMCNKNIITVLPTSIHETASLSMIKIYPNPASSVLHIDNLNGIHSYSIINQQGQRIDSGLLQQGNTQLQIKAFAPGNYLLTIDGLKNQGCDSYRFEKK